MKRNGTFLLVAVAGALAGLALGIATTALAAKSATLTGPSTYVDYDKWQSVCLRPLRQDVGGTPTWGVVATIDACARDGTNPAIVECKSASRWTSTPPASVTNIVNYMVTAYCTDNGC